MDVDLCSERRFVEPDCLEWDLEGAARKARLLAWTYEKVCTSEFSTTSDNEFAWQLGELFLGVLAADFAKASDIAEEHHIARKALARAPGNIPWESYFRERLIKTGLSATEADAELVIARGAIAAVAARG